MPRFMMMVKADENFRRSGPPPAELMDAIDKLGVEAMKNGKMVMMGGLKHSSQGATVRVTDGKLVTTDGPFAEAKEIIGGFSIMECGSKEEAVEEGRKFMELHRRLWPGWEGETEIRQMYDDGDRPPGR